MELPDFSQPMWFLVATLIIFAVVIGRYLLIAGLFYGSFYKMKYDAYEEGMRNMMEDPDFLYGTMIKDIYWQGRVMGRKFRLLHISYNIFMYGIALVVISYGIAALIDL